MPKRIHITTPWPTFEEMTRHLRIPKARQKELDELAKEGVRQILRARKGAAQKTVAKQKVKVGNASAAD
jgi:hypothetical protein